MSLLSIDPSSTRVGWAIWSDGQLQRCGAIQPKSKKKWCRIRFIVEKAEMIWSYYGKPTLYDVVVIEDPYSGPNTSALTFTAGAVFAVCHRMTDEIHMVNPKTWTRGLKKEQRADWVEQTFGDIYNRAKDKGLDVADAIGLGHWFLENERIRAQGS